MASLYYTSTLICLATTPKHISIGIHHVHKAIDQIPAIPESARGKALAPTTWDFSVGVLGILSLLNYKWATKGGPRTWEESAVIYTWMCTGAVIGWRYFRMKMYPGLGFLWLAPALSVLGMWVG
ncbi:hypothetical protein ASPWEDRAFT_35433 [Aspergillus wentii DTO 134E9]|uniref:Ergosterol biosynthesis protein n=1 Tax=Aspergillus wentii DTO 134E9 TaxID=1073089 RepID=A0A1L9S3S6_ASPWE|nr:uncharacterized protein ASPWEDRAFT_35433 [Aspergillus wentii DTO 134E9]KAI9930150.1 hypothetical protein MW887_011960 [Aspergillus wentii]OJJ41818.1 hypothetical protein ASPWEDRAFT_35433 [Aspergillus wentii DTO 134E9]